ncbi:MAG: heavy metal sensor histidine kinase [Acidobacteriia bacterium]|nr:heavy metal sensor histidine kinase [Terriglobia bacterium]
MRTTDGKRRPLGLRLRLTLSYVIIFTILLAAVGALFRQQLKSSLDNNTTLILDEEAATVKGYLQIEHNVPVWKYDPKDTEEAFIVQRLRRIFLLTGSDGRVLEVSDAYNSLGVESKKELQSMLGAGKPVWRVRKDDRNSSYLIRSAVLTDDGGRKFLLTIGRTLDANEKLLSQFTRNYFTIVPLFLLASSALGWIMAGRALSPVNDVVRAAQSITGDNLGLRIPPRGAGDELDHLIEAFNSMVDRLQSSFSQVRQFSIDVSHELRTPLTAVRGELEVALFSARTVEQYRDAIATAIESVEQLSQVVRALLHLSQAETGLVALDKTSLDLTAIVNNVVDQFQIPAEMEGIHMQSLLEPCRIEGDKIQIERLISNLLSNAIRYTGKGGTVLVGLRSAGNRVELSVEDTGRGIPSKHIPHIFERFYRVSDGNVDPERGLGLGLSFVAWIAKVHGAKINVLSEPGAGSRFEVNFPAGSSPEALPDAARERRLHASRAGAIES